MESITYEDIKAKYEKKLSKDDIATCKFLLKLKDGYLVNVNNEWEGFIPTNQMVESVEEKLYSKEEFEAVVVSGPDKGDRYTVSAKARVEKAVWESLEKSKANKETITVKIAKPIKGGAEIFIDGVRAFLPGRYIRLPGLKPDDWVNKEINVLIEELSYSEKKVILNQKKAVENERKIQAEVTIQRLNEGDIVEAPILRVAEFGIFVDLGGLDGLVPASELSWGRFNHPKDIAKVGDLVRARIFRIDKENKRIALSVKQLQGDPWEDVENEFAVGTEVEGKVIGEAPFGLFVQIKPGVEALLHKSEVAQAENKPNTGDAVKAKVIKLEVEERRIGLSLNLKGTSEEPVPETSNTDSSDNEVQSEPVETVKVEKTPEEMAGNAFAVEQSNLVSVTSSSSNEENVETENKQDGSE